MSVILGQVSAAIVDTYVASLPIGFDRTDEIYDDNKQGPRCLQTEDH